MPHRLPVITLCSTHRDLLIYLFLVHWFEAQAVASSCSNLFLHGCHACEACTLSTVYSQGRPFCWKGWCQKPAKYVMSSVKLPFPCLFTPRKWSRCGRVCRLVILVLFGLRSWSILALSEPACAIDQHGDSLAHCSSMSNRAAHVTNAHFADVRSSGARPCSHFFGVSCVRHTRECYAHSGHPFVLLRDSDFASAGFG
jgi:hypothetical protein